MKEELESILTDVLNGKFGTKNRSELIRRLIGVINEIDDNKGKLCVV